MNSEPPSFIRWLVQALEGFIDWIIDLVRQGKWSTLLLLLAATAVSLLSPDKGIAYQWLSPLLAKEQYPIYFLIGMTLIILLAFVIRFLGLDKPISRSWAIFLACLTVIAFIFAVFTSLQPSTTSNLYSMGDKLSWGEEFLTRENSKCKSGRANATVYFKKPDYKIAEGFYEEYVNNCSYEPEAQIYFSNAKALQTKNFMRIVVSIPISRPDQGLEHSEEVLRGVALAQNEWNSRNSSRQLVVGIANDGYAGEGNCGQDGNDGECGEARKIAQRLVQQSNVLGVIGHFSSDATEATAKDYEKGQLVLISPTSTAVRINDPKSCSQPDTRNGVCLNSYVFRTASNDSISVTRLINFIGKRNSNSGIENKIKKVAIVYERNSTYSRFYRKVFAEQFVNQAGEGSVVNSQPDLENPCNFSMKIGFSPEKCLEASQQANALLLVPSTKNATQVGNVLRVNKSTSRLALLGADSMYNYPFIRDQNKQPKTEAEGMLLVVPWQRSDEKCSKGDRRLECRSAVLFGKSEASTIAGNSESNSPLQISWRTATAFDATQALSKGLSQTLEQKCRFNILDRDQCVRSKLKDTLSLGFEVEGTLGNGKVKFDDQGDRIDDGEIAVIVEARQGEFKQQ